MLKQLSELRRNKELKSRQIETIITKAEDFMKSNPPQVAKSVCGAGFRDSQSAFLDTEEVEDKFNR